MVPARSHFKRNEGALSTAILARAIRRDPQALEAVFDFYYDRVYSHVAQLVRDRTLAEDLTQNTFLRLQKTIDQLDPQRDPTGWIFTVATNLTRDHWRSAAHKRQKTAVPVDADVVLSLPHPDADVQSALEADEDLQAVWNALQQLTVDDREIILLRDYEELGTTDIAAMLALKPDAVRQRHSRAVARLSRLYHQQATSERGES